MIPNMIGYVNRDHAKNFPNAPHMFLICDNLCLFDNGLFCMFNVFTVNVINFEHLSLSNLK